MKEESTEKPKVVASEIGSGKTREKQMKNGRKRVKKSKNTRTFLVVRNLKKFKEISIKVHLCM